MSHDPITNVDVHRDNRHKVDVDKEYAFMKNRIPFGATTHQYKTGKIIAGKLDRSDITVKKNPMNPTDHISYNPPDSTKP